MAHKVFISFRFNDGNYYKQMLTKKFDTSIEVINCSENEDRSNLSEYSIQKYLYDKLRTTSVTIAILTPNAIQYEKDFYGKYDDWLYDEVRYSLENREGNRSNGLIAVYTPEVEGYLFTSTYKPKHLWDVKSFNNLIYHNLFNKKNSNLCCDLDDDSYCLLVSWSDFISNFNYYIEEAFKRRENQNEYNIRKRL